MKEEVKRCRLCSRKRKKPSMKRIRAGLYAMGIGRVPLHPGATVEPSRLPK